MEVIISTTINYYSITVETGLVYTGAKSIENNTIGWELYGQGVLSVNVSIVWVNVNGNPVPVSLSADNNEIDGQLST